MRIFHIVRNAQEQQVDLTRQVEGNHNFLTWFSRGHFQENRRTLTLTLPEIQALHIIMRDQWDEWVDAAPVSWKRDNFLGSNVPMAITMRYGQNQEIASSPRYEDEEREAWHMDHKYSNIRQCTMSIASLFR